MLTLLHFNCCGKSNQESKFSTCSTGASVFVAVMMTASSSNVSRETFGTSVVVVEEEIAEVVYLGAADSCVVVLVVT